MDENILKKLNGIQDARGMRGILSRGKNVYRAGSNAAHKGGGISYPKVRKSAIQRRLRRVNGR